MTILPWLRWLTTRHASEDWGFRGSASARDAAACDEIAAPAAPAPDVVGLEPGPVVDLEERAAAVRYRHNQKIKRTYYPRRDVAKIRAIVLHQMGVTRKPNSDRWHRVSAHRVIGPDGARMRVHPLGTRLMCSNALDRRPWYAVGIEVAGNFEGVDGGGGWYKPDTFGRGRATEQQLVSMAEEIRSICREVGAAGGRVELLAPHRVSGRRRDGRPNRPICPGSRIWERGEIVAAEEGLAVPGPDWTIGGLPIPASWRSGAPGLRMLEGGA